MRSAPPIATIGLFACATILLGSTARHSAVAETAGGPPDIKAIPAPAGSRSSLPQLTVSPGGVLLSWVERDGPKATLKFAERRRDGWSPAVTVASGDNWFVNWADVPSVLRLGGSVLVAHWLQKSGSGTYAYDVRLSRSTDNGRTWSAPITPHHDGLEREHGFASLLRMPGNGLGLIWLDGRHTSPTADHQEGTSGGAMSLRYGTFDQTWKQVRDVEVDNRVCDCCPTTAVMTADGPVIAYRNRSDDETRDIYVSRLERGAWTEPRPVHADNWRIAACPVNGPMLSARGRDVALAWFTAKDESGRAYIAFSKDAGRSFGAPIRLDAGGTLGRVDVALAADGAAWATWIETTDGSTFFVARRVDATGHATPVVKVAAIAGGRMSGYPRLAASGSELVFAWTDAGAVKTAVADSSPRATGTSR